MANTALLHYDPVIVRALHLLIFDIARHISKTVEFTIIRQGYDEFQITSQECSKCRKADASHNVFLNHATPYATLQRGWQVFLLSPEVFSYKEPPRSLTHLDNFGS